MESRYGFRSGVSSMVERIVRQISFCRVWANFHPSRPVSKQICCRAGIVSSSTPRICFSVGSPPVETKTAFRSSWFSPDEAGSRPLPRWHSRTSRYAWLPKELSGQDWQSIHLPPNGCPRSCRRSWSYRPCRRVLASRILRSYPHLRVTSSERRGKCASDRPRCVGSPDRSPGERFAAYRGRYPFSRNRVQTSPAYPCPADRTSECCSPQCRTVGCPAGLSCAGFLFGNRVMQKAVAYEFHQPIRIYALMVFCKRCGCSLMNETTLYSFCRGGWQQHFPCCVMTNLSPRIRFPSLSVRINEERRKPKRRFWR